MYVLLGLLREVVFLGLQAFFVKVFGRLVEHVELVTEAVLLVRDGAGTQECSGGRCCIDSDKGELHRRDNVCN